MRERLKLGEVLLRAGILDEAQLAQALALQRAAEGPRRRLGAVVEGLGFASEDLIATAIAEQTGLPYLDVGSLVPDPAIVAAVPQRLAEHYILVPVERSSDLGIVVAMADPTNVVAIDDVRVATGAPEVRPVVATATSIREAIRRSYGLGGRTDAIVGKTAASEIETVAAEAAGEDIADVKRQTEAAPIVQLVNAMLADAAKAGATDIHVEPQPMDLRVRYRVDGVLREALTLPKRVQTAVLSRLKLLAGIDIAERRRPQDGRGRFRVGGAQIDMRISTMPTMAGEKAVVRLLPRGDEFIGIEGLGLGAEGLATLERYLTMPQGLIVFTGPTGSGKTTSMYAALQRLRGPERNVITLEDPIEYQMPWVNQVQIDERIGLSFARGLRAALRQDPNVILVGEIRDVETARIVVQAAMTGHLVLTTLHTNDAPSAIARLVEMGVESFLVASSLSLVVAQRLARTVCGRCAEPAAPIERTLDLLGLAPEDVRGATLRAGEGCAACGFTGYRGRTGIYELLPVTHEIREAIGHATSGTALSIAARAAGMRTLRRDALDKACAGTTTLEEVVRTTHFEREDTRRCPECRREVERTFLACPFCRASLGRRLCGSCGRAAEPEWKGCPYCAAPLEPLAPAVAPGRPRLLAAGDDAGAPRGGPAG